MMLARDWDVIDILDGVTVRFYLIGDEVAIDLTLPDGRTVDGNVPIDHFVDGRGEWDEFTICAFMEHFCGLLRFAPIVNQFMAEAS